MPYLRPLAQFFPVLTSWVKKNIILFFSVNTVLEIDCIEEDYEDRRERDPTLASLNVPSPPKMPDLDPDVEMHAITKVCLSYVYEGLSK